METGLPSEGATGMADTARSWAEVADCETTAWRVAGEKVGRIAFTPGPVPG